MNNDLLIIPYNKTKIFEANLIQKFINVNNAKIIIINYNNKINLNEEIIDKFKNKPDIIIIINFNENSEKIKLIKNIPRIPIFINNIFYLSPIIIKNLNGFSNKTTNKTELINNFIYRIIKLYGSIISNNNYKIPNINIKLESKTHETLSGINDYEKNSILRNSFICKIPKWMTKNIDITNKGWFAKSNQYCFDYVLNNYKLKNIVELGSYFGLSSYYIAKKMNKECNLYCCDFFENIFFANYNVNNITPLELEYFYKYFRFESFSAKLSEFNNVILVKYDCYKVPKLLFNNKIDVSLFYIDFCKKDNLLIEFVNEIFSYYPNCIIIGDDVVYLDSSLKYFKSKYTIIIFDSCYILVNNFKLLNTELLIQKYEINKNLENINNINEVKNLNFDYKINFIIKNIKNKNIFKIINKLKIDPNKQSYYIDNNGNLFHYIAKEYWSDQYYFLNLYNEINKYIQDKNIKNDLNLTPNDYFNYHSIIEFR